MPCPLCFPMILFLREKLNSWLMNLNNIVSPLLVYKKLNGLGLQNIWPIGDWTLLHSGHVLSVNGAVVKRKDGIGILLSRQASAA